MPGKKCGHLVPITTAEGTQRHACIRDAICHITYFTDGSGGSYACAQHRDVVIVAVASALTVGPPVTLKYTPLGSHAARIERQYHRNRKAVEA